MIEYADSFLRGCRIPNYVEQDAEFGNRISPSAFFPDERYVASDNTCETSITWNDDDKALKAFFDMEKDRENHGNVQFGVADIDFLQSIEYLNNASLSQYISFDRKPDVSLSNKYHGNIRFDADYCLIRNSSGKNKPNKQNLRKICNCFALSQNRFYTFSEMKCLFSFDA